MDASDNIIPFPDARSAQASLAADKRLANRQNEPDPILEALKREPRQREWFPVFASNLGEMARRLNPERPLEGAKRMFHEAFGATADANWRKRKRYLRLEGEATAFDAHGEYVSNIEPYLSLAGAFAKLEYRNDREGSRKANRLLVRGTPLNPTPSLDASKIDGLSQVVDCLKLVEVHCLADPEIPRALDCLNRYPIAPFGDRADNHSMLAAERSDGFSIVADATSTVADCTSTDDLRPQFKRRWYVGRVLLGYLYFPQAVSIVSLGIPEEELTERVEAGLAGYRIPEASLNYVRAYEANDQTAYAKWSELRSREMANVETNAPKIVYDMVDSKFTELGVEGFYLGDEEFDDAPIPDKLRNIIHIRKPVFLILTHDGVRPLLKLEIGAEWFAFGEPTESQWYDVPNPEVVELGSRPELDELVLRGSEWVTFKEFVGVGLILPYIAADVSIEDWSMRLFSRNGDVRAIGGSETRKYPVPSYLASLDDAELRDALLQGATPQRAFFRSMIWDDLGRLSAAPHGSIAGCILRNLAFAPDEERIDVRLAKDARERLEGVVDFVRAELEKTNASLGARGLEAT